MKNVLRLFKILADVVFVAAILSGLCTVGVVPMPGIEIEFLGVSLGTARFIFDDKRMNCAYILDGFEVAGVEVFGIVIEPNGSARVVW